MCEVRVTGGQAVLSWSRSDQPGVDLGGVAKTEEISNTGIWLSTKTYTFTPNRNMNSNPTMKFGCTAEYGGQTKSTSWAVFVYVIPTGPKITSSNIVVSGQPATLVCEATFGNTVPSLNWRIGSDFKRGNSVESANGDSTYNVVNSLTQTFTVADDGKTIYCDMQYDLPNYGKTVSQKLSVQYAPNVTVALTSYTVNEGGMVTLQCTVISTPPASIVRWTKDGTAVDRTSGRFSNGNSVAQASLTISNVQATDIGTYVCYGTNTIAEARSPDVILNVRYGPKVVISSLHISTDEGKNVELSCSIDSNPAITQIQWIRIKDTIETTLTLTGRFTGGSLTSPSTLTISSVEPEDAGGYRCQAVNAEGTGRSQDMTLVVNYAPRAVTLTPSSLTVQEGRPINIQCRADAFPSSSYKWYYPSGTFTSGPLLTVTASLDHNGVFTCVASNSIGNASKNIDVNVLYSPRFQVGSSPLSANEGDASLTISCVIDANPPVTSVSWRKNLNVLDLLTPAGKYSGGTVASPSLVIRNVEVSDGGNYVCSAQNSQSALVFSSVVEVKINYAPRNLMIIPSSPLTFREGNNYILNCRADGVPVPTFVWTLNGVVKTVGTSLNFLSVGPEDAGLYTCNVTNSRGGSVIQATVLVQYSPKFTLPSSSFGGDKGGSLNIEYSIQAYPAITTFEWFKDNQKINLTTPDGKYEEGLANSTRLVINDLQPSDAGSYTIRASNSIGGTESDPIMVAISYTPRNTQTNPSGSIVITEGDTTVIACTTDSFPPATFIWYRGATQIADSANLTISEATPDDAGQLKCTATNGKGSNSADFSIVVRYKPRAFKSYSIVSTSVGQTARLQCSTHAYPPVTGYVWRFGNTTLSETGPVLLIIPTSSSSVYFGVYVCVATNELGMSEDILILLLSLSLYLSLSPLCFGASTAGDGLSVTAIVLIVLSLLILLIAIIIIIWCYKNGVCSKICPKRKKGKGRITPISHRQIAAVEIPHLTEQQKPEKEPNYMSGESRNPSSTAVSRKDVDVNVNQFTKPADSTIIIEDDYEKNTRIPNGTGPIISLGHMPYQLPPLGTEIVDGTPEKKKKHKRKRRHYKNEENGRESRRSENDYTHDTDTQPPTDHVYSTVA
ncbi:hemicentin-1-like [Gigantopelta aegis]|uniref:hemicentin-1-like n=1 Tax=Gigantopelta aegis TaxID=1735272 RepID=UPI001B8892A3|nr:hemicentin-1-like [Gigantopelta aegis]